MDGASSHMSGEHDLHSINQEQFLSCCWLPLWSLSSKFPEKINSSIFILCQNVFSHVHYTKIIFCLWRVYCWNSRNFDEVIGLPVNKQWYVYWKSIVKRSLLEHENSLRKGAIRRFPKRRARGEQRRILNPSVHGSTRSNPGRSKALRRYKYLPELLCPATNWQRVKGVSSFGSREIL